MNFPWKLSFQYFDQATNSLKELKTKPGEEELSRPVGEHAEGLRRPS